MTGPSAQWLRQHQWLRRRSRTGLARPLWLAVVLSTAVGCSEPEAAPKPRTNAVTVASSSTRGAMPVAPATARANTAAMATTAKPRPDPCAGQALRDAPGKLSRGRAVGSASVPAAASYGKGRWLWVNVWAAWCEPCKKEMPTLLAWRDKLRKQGVPLDLAFVSIDDDERELTRFMQSQPASGVRASYWLEGEELQTDWFASVGFGKIPTLPVHAFVSPAGKTACVIEGSVEPGDYTAIAKLTAAR